MKIAWCMEKRRGETEGRSFYGWSSPLPLKGKSAEIRGQRTEIGVQNAGEGRRNVQRPTPNFRRSKNGAEAEGGGSSTAQTSAFPSATWERGMKCNPGTSKIENLELADGERTRKERKV